MLLGCCQETTISEGHALVHEARRVCGQGGFKRCHSKMERLIDRLGLGHRHSAGHEFCDYLRHVYRVYHCFRLQFSEALRPRLTLQQRQHRRRIEHGRITFAFLQAQPPRAGRR